jgi:N-acetylmuramoyl-L-alanine amidase
MNITERTSPNRTPGRGGRKVDRVVYHHTGGNFEGSLNWVLNPASQVSYHYMVNQAGQVWRTVPEADTAWANGTWDMNQRAISICADTSNWPAAMRDSFVQLTREVCGRYGIAINRANVIRHREVPGHPGTQCPGTLPIDDWVAIAAGGGPVAPAGGFLNMLSDTEQRILYDRIGLLYWALCDEPVRLIGMNAGHAVVNTHEWSFDTLRRVKRLEEAAGVPASAAEVSHEPPEGADRPAEGD